MKEEKIVNTENIENVEDVTSLDVVKEEYEKKLSDQKEEYESRIKAMHEQHIAELRTLMKTGTSPEAEELKEELSEEEVILQNLRNKYHLN